MKWYELKINCLKYLNTTYNNIDYQDWENLQHDETVSDYLIKMNDSINRCLEEISKNKKLPTKIYDVKDSDLAYLSNKYYRFNVDSIENFYLIKQINALCGSEYVLNIDFIYENGDTILLPNNPRMTYFIVYYPLPIVVSSDYDDILLPQDIVNLIPYWVKADLYIQEEPAEAQESRALFYQALNSVPNKERTQHRVKKVYGIL